jgi:hypothetical protein
MKDGEGGSKSPATLEAVMEAVMQLSTLSEAKILEFVSAGKVADLFPFIAARHQPIPSDILAEEDLVEASPSPLNRKEREDLIQSMTSPKKYRPRTDSKR